MLIRRACAVAAFVAASLFLSGCFVVSTSLPQGSGPINDERLVGDWVGIDTDSGKPSNAYLHFQRYDEQKPLRLVWVEGKDYQIYELITRRVGNRQIFAATHIGPQEGPKDEPDVPNGFFIGYYDVAPNEATFYMLDSEKVSALIKKGRVAGKEAPGKYDIATLTGSPAELARFLASDEAFAARAKAAKLRRAGPPR